MNDVISTMVDMPEGIYNLLTKYLDTHPGIGLDSVVTAAIAAFLRGEENA